MKLGDLVKRRVNGDLALVVGILGCHDGAMKIVHLKTENTQYVWFYDYKVISTTQQRRLQ